MFPALLDALPTDAGGQSLTYFLGTCLVGLAGFVAVLIRAQSATATKQIDEANERAKSALLSGAATTKEERDRADERERTWLAKLDKVAAAQEELDGNISNIHALLDGLVNAMRERQSAGMADSPPPPTVRRRAAGGEG